MALILSLETSTSSCSAALHLDGKLVSGRELHEPQLAASQLAVLISEVLAEAGVVPKQIAAVAVSAGPGSYTGLRIAVATAKGFCYPTSTPLIAVNSLLLLASQVREQAGPTDMLCPMIDARRMEVYTMLLNRNLDEIEPIVARIIDESSYREVLSKSRVLFFGTGSDKCRDAIRHANAHFISGIVPTALKLGDLAEARFRAGRFEDVATFEPLYLKDFLIRKPKSQV
jgi:tRNA threonylcarbamoyladenosine biosynthesis protein TsaB